MKTRKIRLDDELPGLYIPDIQCAHCFQGVSIEDGSAYCYTCMIWWVDIYEGAVGQFIEDDDECGKLRSEVLPARQVEGTFEYKGEQITVGNYQACILPASHTSFHVWPHDYEATPIEGETP